MTTTEHQHTDVAGDRLEVWTMENHDLVYVAAENTAGRKEGATVRVTPDQAPSVARAVLAKRSDVAVVEGLPEVDWVESTANGLRAYSVEEGAVMAIQSNTIDDTEIRQTIAGLFAILAHRKAEREQAAAEAEQAAAETERRDHEAAVTPAMIAAFRSTWIGGPVSDDDVRSVLGPVLGVLREPDLAPIPEPGAVLDATHPEPPAGSMVTVNGCLWHHDKGEVLSWWTDESSVSGWERLQSWGTVTLVRWGPQA